MNAEEVAMTLAEYGNRIRVSEHRIEDLEEQQKQMTELTISVKELALSVKNMVAEQKNQSERIRKIEEEPADSWKAMKKSMITAMIGVVAGALVTGAIAMMANFI